MLFVVRGAADIWSHGVTAVSGVETRTRLDVGASASCAAIWASAVNEPWPISTVPVRTLRRPVGVELGHADEGNALMPLMIAATPLARTLRARSRTGACPSGSQPIFSAAVAQQLRVVEVLVDRLAGRELVAWHQDVREPQLERVHAQRVREIVHLRLVRPRHLRDAESAERAPTAVMLV